jgi:impB/mucB/samB family
MHRKVAAEVRREIYDTTQCPASAGGGSSILLARLATKRAKPNGQYFLAKEDAIAIISPLPVTVSTVHMRYIHTTYLTHHLSYRHATTAAYSYCDELSQLVVIVFDNHV